MKRMSYPAQTTTIVSFRNERNSKLEILPGSVCVCNIDIFIHRRLNENTILCLIFWMTPVVNASLVSYIKYFQHWPKERVSDILPQNLPQDIPAKIFNQKNLYIHTHTA